MRDIDIRMKLHDKLRLDFSKDSDTIVIDELGICQGESRIDIAVVNGALHGYEIKSESDTLIRLPLQIEYYSKVFDTVTIVTSKSHIEKAIKLIPEWWGIEIAQEGKTHEISIINFRSAEINSNIDPLSVAQLLWKDEVISIIKMLAPSAKISNKTKMELWKILINIISKDELCSIVRDILRNSIYRQNWRSDSLQRLDDDSSQPFSML